MAVSPGSLNLTRMIDIHCHVLPETDDGAIYMEESVAMCRAAADGIKTTVATPHMFNGVYAAPDKETINQKIAAVTQSCDACVNICSGRGGQIQSRVISGSRRSGRAHQAQRRLVYAARISFPFIAAEHRDEDIPDIERGRNTGHRASRTQQASPGGTGDTGGSDRARRVRATRRGQSDEEFGA